MTTNDKIHRLRELAPGLKHAIAMARSWRPQESLERLEADLDKLLAEPEPAAVTDAEFEFNSALESLLNATETAVSDRASGDEINEALKTKPLFHSTLIAIHAARVQQARREGFEAGLRELRVFVNESLCNAEDELAAADLSAVAQWSPAAPSLAAARDKIDELLARGAEQAGKQGADNGN